MAAPTATPAAAAADAPADYGSFRLLQTVPLDYAPVRLSKWRSDKTGLTVTLGKHSTPIVRLRFFAARSTGVCLEGLGLTADKRLLCDRFREWVGARERSCESSAG